MTRGTARFGLPQPVSVAPSNLKAGPSLIATLPVRNTQLEEGAILLTASGRPVFILQGELPAYRDLVPGSAGENVRQLEEALTRLGFDPGPADGTYDRRTSAAVARWYEYRGWEPFGPTRAQTAAVRSIEQAWEDARKTELAATAALSAAGLEVEAARASAEAGDSAAAAVKSAALAGKRAIRAALDARRIAEFEADLAARRVSRLSARLERARSKLGIQVPVDELMFLPALPVRVEAIQAAVGDAATGTLLSVTDNRLSIDASLPLETAPLVRPGMMVRIDEQALGVTATGLVKFVADRPGTRGVDGFHFYFEVAVEETAMKLEGFSLRLTIIPIESTAGEVIAVPASALSLSADGTSRIRVERGDALDYVAVKPGMSADGFVAVTPLAGELNAGELVVVGVENPSDGLPP